MKPFETFYQTARLLRHWARNPRKFANKKRPQKKVFYLNLGPEGFEPTTKGL